MFESWLDRPSHSKDIGTILPLFYFSYLLIRILLLNLLSVWNSSSLIVMMVKTMCHLGRLQYPVIQSNINTGVSVKVLPTRG